MTSVQFKPSIIREIFADIKKFYDDMQHTLSTNESTKAQIREKGLSDQEVPRKIIHYEFEFKKEKESLQLFEKLMKILEPVKSQLKITIDFSKQKY